MTNAKELIAEARAFLGNKAIAEALDESARNQRASGYDLRRAVIDLQGSLLTTTDALEALETRNAALERVAKAARGVPCECVRGCDRRLGCLIVLEDTIAALEAEEVSGE